MKETKYMKIRRSQRMKLIRLIEKRGKSIKRAAEDIDISPSTARAIYNKYRKEGKIFEKKEAKAAREQKLLQKNSQVIRPI